MTLRAVYDLATGEIVRSRPAVGPQVPPPAGCGVVDVTECASAAVLKQRYVSTATVSSGGTYALSDANFPKRCELRVTAQNAPKVGKACTMQVKAYDGNGIERGAIRPYHITVMWGPDIIYDADGATNASGTSTIVITLPGSRPIRGGKEQPYGLAISVRPLGLQERGSRLHLDVED